MTNDDHPTELLVALKQEHRRLDEQIEALIEAGAHDQIELARLKKRKLQLKDQIALINDSAIPDIIA
ncbi:MAG: YdcH family protein [Sphingomicrobium sp.]